MGPEGGFALRCLRPDKSSKPPPMPYIKSAAVDEIMKAMVIATMTAAISQSSAMMPPDFRVGEEVSKSCFEYL